MFPSDLLRPRPLSPYDEMLLSEVANHGGFYNAHTHLDRADTINDSFLSHINTTPIEASNSPLSVKQNLTGDLHRGPAYQMPHLKNRMREVIERLISYGTAAVDTCIDATSDLPANGLLAINAALELKVEFAGKIKIRIAPMPIFGFKEGSGRWETFVAAAQLCDFIAALPEKDDFSSPADRDGKVGFREHLRRVIRLGAELKKEVHVHLDQANDPRERGAATLIECLRWIDAPQLDNPPRPGIWVIHMISPSAYPEKKFARLLDGLLEHNLGVICCPTAAISMRQLRPIAAPTHNSIARLLDLMKKKIPVRIGTDNICDVFVPQSDGDMLTEIKMAGHAVRFASPSVWAKIAAGVPLNEVDRTSIGRTLWEERKSFRQIDPFWTPAVE